MRQPRDMKQILIATDGSPGAQLAVEEGVWLAKMLDAKVILIAVARPPLPLLGDPYYQRTLSADLRSARAAIASAIPVAEERSVPYESDVVAGVPAEAIRELARTRNVDLIVVGSRGRGAVTGAVLGSVSADIVHRADRPVLVARPRMRARHEGVLRAAV
jgi:nucleotide-binding universal stress UspA family protein